jgi:hypothetical protein
MPSGTLELGASPAPGTSLPGVEPAFDEPHDESVNVDPEISAQAEKVRRRMPVI